MRELDEGFNGTDKRPGEVLSIVKKASAYIGLKPHHEVLLDKLFMLTQPQDWTGATAVGPVVFGSNDFLADELDITVRSLQRHLGDLIELGLIAPRVSPTGVRWGRRDEQGHLTEAYGFSLSPCAVRYDEFAEASSRRIADRRERKRLSDKITYERRRLAAAAERAQAGWSLFNAWLEEVKAILAEKVLANLKRLRDLAARMTELRIEAEAAAKLSLGPDEREGWTKAEATADEASQGAESSAEPDVENADRASETDDAKQTSSPFKRTNTSPADDSTDTRITTTHQTPSLRESCTFSAEGRWSRPWVAAPSPEIEVTEDLEKRHVTAAMVMGLVTAPRLGDIGRDPDWSLVYAEAEQLAHDRRLDMRMIGQLQQVIGRRGAAVAVITTARKADRWEVRNEGGYLREMLNRAEVGKLKLGGTVRGLVQAAEKEREAIDV